MMRSSITKYSLIGTLFLHLHHNCLLLLDFSYLLFLDTQSLNYMGAHAEIFKTFAFRHGMVYVIRCTTQYICRIVEHCMYNTCDYIVAGMNGM